ncbi:hypothetical protein J5300_07255 [Riemerella anatipestifer]|uniref:hypothetical protein n=1 Tax=Riemerella anatipestifer TaxID=34085 RepID=UPI001BDAB232|nr:hypothetical protein [Riemerella anatipestifer]MBT0540038.1 hypothetical protein [Riemerella anatipestifer]MBT0543899.1 hypothetical protein [Riemerella anatipestifer]MBT0545866.1 hypothetical protein [Riemerella anatipestifer]MBT0547802.1 hypothetical protein [Riemerella anatipestifer]MBT0552239.1 hypothetical protein [Riemerella anatipestifer]
MFKSETTAPTANNSSEVQNQETIDRAKRLSEFNSCFGVDQDNLFYIVTEQIDMLTGEIHKGYYQNAEQRVANLASLLWAMHNRLPKDFFEDVELLTDDILLNTKSA